VSKTFQHLNIGGLLEAMDGEAAGGNALSGLVEGWRISCISHSTNLGDLTGTKSEEL